MLKTILSILLAIVAIAALTGFALGIYSQRLTGGGLVNGKLKPCPESPNCVCSENQNHRAEYQIDALRFSQSESSRAWAALLQAIRQSGGDFIESSDTYVHATYSTRIFRFVDDLEARLDTENSLIHLRSASRVGHSDLGANLKRIEAIRKAYQETLDHS